MGFFRRRDQEPPPIPEWAAFFDREQYRTFLGLVDLDLERRGLEREWGDGVVAVGTPDGPMHLGLATLAQLVNGESADEWEQIVRDHLGRAVAADDRDENVDWEHAEPVLKLRLWARDQLPEGLDLVARPFAEDLLVVLSFDWPDAVTNVKREHLQAWGKSEQELFALAERTTRAEPDLETQSIEFVEGATAYGTVGDSFFTSSQILWPEQIAGEIPPDGALVAAPHRHLALVHPITDIRVVQVIPRAAMWVHQCFVEGPGSLSPELYWWRSGRALRLNVDASGDTVQIAPPDEFVELLDALGEDGA